MSDGLVIKIRDACARTDQSKKVLNAQAYNKFVNWKRTEKEVCLFTLYAYADFTLPKQFDCIFRLDSPLDFLNTKLQLTQSLFEGKFPVERIEHGHKHLCIFEFEKEVPSIVNELYIGTGFHNSPPNGSLKLGICQSGDFKEIKNRQEDILKLKKEYGMEWWKYDKEV
jgi:hypothetical protein